ncbi:phosphate ABC transporter membrane protein 1 (PhoT family) [Orenia metallireducens]|uniref:Phosphate transport system permease protein n=1 Tax=Orenia metallireducens TaxID=1413210 RepID=A0A285HR92_9FIRM|nr:phosphate ABC transporter permease subunit PstC [Orenia metallireducens]PRX25116.1 phosphate ABC transporter membrane protein 1 (PhoT family) [Orenia metallireducens]SNY38290.1 phosphate ABC transporter membrane protein 1, PhoT family [Orenia metallireducens]
MKRRSKFSKIKEKMVEKFFLLNGLLVVFILVGIFYLLLNESLPTFKEVSIVEFFTSTTWNPTGYHKVSYGIVSLIFSTIMVTVGSLIFAVPLGIACAAYLSEIAPAKAREILKPTIEILAGIPSVVIGFLGIVLIGPMIAKIFNLPNGLNAINGSVLLGIMALPTIISISEDAINAVPDDYKKASLALGATEWQTLVKVTIPAALSGIIAAVMLGMGRAIGETMAVLMATGNAPAFPKSIFSAVRTLTATIGIELGEVAYNTTHYYSLFAVGLVLFVMTFLINIVSDWVLNKYEEAE